MLPGTCVQSREECDTCLSSVHPSWDCLWRQCSVQIISEHTHQGWLLRCSVNHTVIDVIKVCRSQQIMCQSVQCDPCQFVLCRWVCRSGITIFFKAGDSKHLFLERGMTSLGQLDAQRHMTLLRLHPGQPMWTCITWDQAKESPTACLSQLDHTLSFGAQTHLDLWNGHPLAFRAQKVPKLRSDHTHIHNKSATSSPGGNTWHAFPTNTTLESPADMTGVVHQSSQLSPSLEQSSNIMSQVEHYQPSRSQTFCGLNKYRSHAHASVCAIPVYPWLPPTTVDNEQLLRITTKATMRNCWEIQPKQLYRLCIAATRRR